MKCVEDGIPYIGVCYTKDHAELLYKRVAETVFQKMFKEEGNKFYKPSLAQLLVPKKTPKGETNSESKPKASETKPKAKADPAPKAKPEAKAKGEEKRGIDQVDGAEDDAKRAELRRKLQEKLNKERGDSAAWWARRIQNLWSFVLCVRRSCTAYWPKWRLEITVCCKYS